MKQGILRVEYLAGDKDTVELGDRPERAQFVRLPRPYPIGRGGVGSAPGEERQIERKGRQEKYEGDPPLRARKQFPR